MLRSHNFVLELWVIGMRCCSQRPCEISAVKMNTWDRTFGWSVIAVFYVFVTAFHYFVKLRHKIIVTNKLILVRIIFERKLPVNDPLTAFL